HARRLLGSAQRSAKRRGIVDQLSLKERGDLVTLGHDVVCDDASLVGRVERCFKLRKIGLSNNPRLIGKYVQPGLNARIDSLNLAPIAAGNDDYIAGALLQHPLEEIRPGMNCQRPVGGILFTEIELRDSLQMLDQVGAERRI